jgi:hypothetical protein
MASVGDYYSAFRPCFLDARRENSTFLFEHLQRLCNTKAKPVDGSIPQISPLRSISSNLRISIKRYISSLLAKREGTAPCWLALLDAEAVSLRGCHWVRAIGNPVQYGARMRIDVSRKHLDD